MRSPIFGVILALSIFGPNADASPETGFWDWFKKHEPELFDFENHPGYIFAALAEQLAKVDPNLTFELGQIKEGKRDFIISAEGVKNAFPAVSALAGAAPELPRWRIVRFQPRRSSLSIVTLAGVTLAPNDVAFTYRVENGKLSLTLYIDGYDKSKHATYAGIGYLLLDEILGEYDLGTEISLIEFKAANAASRLPKLPLKALPDIVDKTVESKPARN